MTDMMRELIKVQALEDFKNPEQELRRIESKPELLELYDRIEDLLISIAPLSLSEQAATLDEAIAALKQVAEERTDKRRLS